MTVLSFEVPKKLRSKEAHDEIYSSDCGIPGTYVPNMSDKDNERWKARIFKGENKRVEIRKRFSYPNGKFWQSCAGTRDAGPKIPQYDSAQVLIIVYPDYIRMSSNGRFGIGNKDYEDFQQAIIEAREILEKIK